MKVNRIFSIINFVVFPVSVIFVIYLAIEIHWSIAIFAYILGYLIQNIATNLKCPRCMMPLAWHKYNLYFVKFEWWSPISKRICENCGYDFDNPENGDGE